MTPISLSLDTLDDLGFGSGHPSPHGWGKPGHGRMEAVGIPSAAVLGHNYGGSRAGVLARHVCGHGVDSTAMWPPPLSKYHYDAIQALVEHRRLWPFCGFFPAVVQSCLWGTT